MKFSIMQRVLGLFLKEVYADENKNQNGNNDDNNNQEPSNNGGDDNSGGNDDNSSTEPTNTNTNTNQNTNTNTDSNPSPSGNVDFETLISKARQEERDKLYPEIDKYKTRANDNLLVIRERDDTISEKDKEIENLKSQVEQLESDAKDGRSGEESKLKARITTLENQLEQKDNDHQQELENLKLETYKQNQVSQAQGQIIPELVQGSTQEEIDQSIEKAKQRYQEIAGNANQQNQSQNATTPRANPNMSNANSVFSEMSVEDVRNASPEDWAEQRKKLGLK